MSKDNWVLEDTGEDNCVGALTLQGVFGLRVKDNSVHFHEEYLYTDKLVVSSEKAITLLTEAIEFIQNNVSSITD